MSKLGLNRQILENITNGNQEAIKALERVFSDVGDLMPEQLATAINQAAQAVTAANQALGLLAEVADMLEQLVAAPATTTPAPEFDDLRPAIQMGSISIQEADNVEITGGTAGLSAGTVALPSFYLVDRTTGLYRAALDEWSMCVVGVDMITYKATGMTITKQITSTLATGTPPFVVASTTKVVNLYVDRAALADKATILDAPTAFPAAAIDLPTVITLANALRAAGITKGL